MSVSPTSGRIDTLAGFTATPEDAAATTTLLRAPAAVAASFFLVGALAAQIVWTNGTLEGAVAAGLRSLVVGLVCVPFLLSTRRYRSGQTVMRVWLVAAALAVTLRSIYLCVSLFPLPAGQWIAAVAVQVAVLGAFWLAVYALVWRVSPPPDL
jgi:hypothetical protein